MWQTGIFGRFGSIFGTSSECMHSLNVATSTGVLLFASKVSPCEGVWLKIGFAGGKIGPRRASATVFLKQKKWKTLREASWRPAWRITFPTAVANVGGVDWYDSYSVADDFGLGQGWLLG